MDFDLSETMDEQLKNHLRNAGVKQDVLNALEEDELYTLEMLDATSDNLLKQCGLKIGQILRLRDGIKTFKEQQKECESVDLTGVYPIGSQCSPLTSPCSPQLQSCSQPEASTPSSQGLPLFAMQSASSPLGSLSDVENRCPNSGEKSQGEVSCFATRVAKSDGKWLQQFQLPTKFAPHVLQALKAERMSSAERNDFTRDISTAMMAHTLYPTKSEREHVAFMVIKKYPFLADKLGTGIGSWEQALKNRFKNRRKSKPQSGSVKRPATNQTVETVKRKKAQKLVDFANVPEKPEGETIDTCREHAAAMKKEMLKSTNKNAFMIKELMALTYPFRRERILTEPTAVVALMKEYPALTLVSEFKSEFSRVMGDRMLLKRMSETFTAILKPKLLVLAKGKGDKKFLEEMEDSISMEPRKRSDIEDTAALIMLPHLMNKSNRETAHLLKICSDDECIDDEIQQTVAPQLIGGGEIGDITPMYLVAEREVVLKFNNMASSNALAILMASYYIFNMEYPSSLRNVYMMLEATIMGRTTEAKKRVVVNKFLQELNF